MSDSEKSVSLINFDGLSQIGCALLDKISSAVGWVATHDTPKRIAVEQYIEEIKNSDLDPLLKAAKISRAKRDIKEYCNQAKIISDAIPQINSTSDPSEIDDDWLAIFMDKIRFVSSNELQAIWSRVLSQECNEPNSISLKLVEILSYISTEQAKSFRQICQYCFDIYNIETKSSFDSFPLIADYYPKQNIYFAQAKDLESIGLISVADSTFTLDISKLHFPYLIQIDGHKYAIEQIHDNPLPIGDIYFTSAGRSLCNLIDIQTPPGFLDICLNYWQDYDISLIEVFESPEAEEVENTATPN